jgi:hypothetical protein
MSDITSTISINMAKIPVQNVLVEVILHMGQIQKYFQLSMGQSPLSICLTAVAVWRESLYGDVTSEIIHDSITKFICFGVTAREINLFLAHGKAF